MAYARGTEVPVERSKAEIEKLLTVKGATSFHSGWTPQFASIGFTLKETQVLMGLPMPDTKSFAKLGRTRGEKAYASELRRRWRCALLILKAKFEAIESGISTVEEEFLAHVVARARWLEGAAEGTRAPRGCDHARGQGSRDWHREGSRN